MASLALYQDILGRKNAAHLLRRLPFGSTKKEIDQFANKTPAEALNLLLAKQPEPADPVDPTTGQTWIGKALDDKDTDHGMLKDCLKAWWIDQMITSSLSAVPKLTFFLHTHFTTIESRVNYSQSLYYQIKLLRYYALGNLKTLSKKICLDGAMLRNLDGFLNQAGRPNENFAREFLELYTIGKGPQTGPGDYTNYTEEDIVAAARIFSGYQEDKTFANLDPETGLAQIVLKTNATNLAVQHDASTKQFSHAFDGKTIAPAEKINGLATQEAALGELDELVEMIFAREATARHFCRKLYRFFVYYHITEETENNIIAPLAQTLLANNYEMDAVLRMMFSSKHFYDADNTTLTDNVIGSVIKSPLDIVAGSLRFFRVNLPAVESDATLFYKTYGQAILKPLGEQGLHFYEPYDVAGYDAYHQYPSYHRNWISSNFLARRYEYSKKITEGFKDNEGLLLLRMDIVDYVRYSGNITDPSDATRLVQEFTDYLLPEIITTERFDYYVKVILLDDLSEANWKREWQRYLDTGDDGAVRIQLENLVKTIMQSPEFQLS